MGSPRKPRKKYETPEHPWRKERIESEKLLVEEYGLKNKKEIYKGESKLRSFYHQARYLISSTSLQSKKEEKQLLEKLYLYNLVPDTKIKVESVLNLKLKDIMERRLQTMVYRHGLAKSIKQARQFIVHGHIIVGDRKVTIPNYFVRRDEENKIVYDSLSGLANPENQERIKIEGLKKARPITKEPKEENQKAYEKEEGKEKIDHKEKGKHIKTERKEARKNRKKEKKK